MKTAPRFTSWTLFELLLVLSCAVGTRAWYVMFCADAGLSDAVLQVQGKLATVDQPRARADHEFKSLAPLADKEELTAHEAPGYPWIFLMISNHHDFPEQVMRWLQCALGSLTVAFYFLFARRAFHSTFIATLAGLLLAFYPFWVVNTTELNDGVLAGFLLAACLMFGTRASHTGGALSSLLFGLALACLVMVRAAMLPFALAGLVWLLWRFRRFPLGWYAGLLALAGFANVTPWLLRNYQIYDQPTPIVTSTYYHLWMGNNPVATGGTLDELAMRGTLTEDRLMQCLGEPNQAKRYDMLAVEVANEIVNHPAQTMTRRFKAALAFFLGEHWIKKNAFFLARSDDAADAPAELLDNADAIMTATMLVLLPLALLGWRWSFAWGAYSGLAAIAAIWIPLPYILSHAETLSGPRLPLDGVLIVYAAYALASLIPGAIRESESESLLNAHGIQAP